MRILILLLASLLLFSCKAQRKINAEKYYEENQMDLAALCAVKFPVIPIFKPGETITKTDTVTLAGDSIPCPPDSTGVIVKIPCNPKIITVHESRTDTIIKENTAQIAGFISDKAKLEGQKQVLLSQLEAHKKKSRDRLWIIIAVSTVLGLFIFFKR